MTLSILCKPKGTGTELSQDKIPQFSVSGIENYFSVLQDQAVTRVGEKRIPSSPTVHLQQQQQQPGPAALEEGP